MRIGIIGGRSFARAVAERLSLRHQIEAAWTNDPALGLMTRYWCHSANEARHLFGGLDIVVSAHNYEFVPKSVWEVPERGIIGYHPSLLPRWRGNDAVKWQAEAGDPIVGGTVYKLDEGLDTGPIVCQDWAHAKPGMDASALWRGILFPMGVRLLETALANPVLLESALPQDESIAGSWAEYEEEIKDA